MITKENSILFDNDNEFYDWAVNKTLFIKKSEGGTFYTDFDLSYAYNKAIEEGKTLYIMDENSVITKRGCVTFNTLSKKVNVETYYGQEYI